MQRRTAKQVVEIVTVISQACVLERMEEGDDEQNIWDSAVGGPFTVPEDSEKAEEEIKRRPKTSCHLTDGQSELLK